MLLKTYELENETFPSAKPGRKAYTLHKMASLVFYSYARGFTKASVIADLAKNHHYFKYVANGIEPDETPSIILPTCGVIFLNIS